MFINPADHLIESWPDVLLAECFLERAVHSRCIGEGLFIQGGHYIGECSFYVEVYIVIIHFLEKYLSGVKVGKILGITAH